MIRCDIMKRPAARLGRRFPPRRVHEPSIAAVGYTLQQRSTMDPARRSTAIRCTPAPASSARARVRGRIVVDESRRRDVGATFTGPDVADMLHAATVAIVGEVPLRRLVHAIPSFPTAARCGSGCWSRAA